MCCGLHALCVACVLNGYYVLYVVYSGITCIGPVWACIVCDVYVLCIAECALCVLVFYVHCYNCVCSMCYVLCIRCEMRMVHLCMTRVMCDV